MPHPLKRSTTVVAGVVVTALSLSEFFGSKNNDRH